MDSTVTIPFEEYEKLKESQMMIYKQFTRQLYRSAKAFCYQVEYGDKKEIDDALTVLKSIVESDFDVFK